MFRLSICIAAFGASLAVAQPLARIDPEQAGFSADGLARIDRFFSREVESNRVPGAVVAIEPAAAPSLTKGVYAYDFGDTGKLTPLVKMHTLGHDFIPEPIHAGGLRYHGMAPLVSLLKEEGLIEARSTQQNATFEAGVTFARNEGILPAPEANHAIRAAIDEALDAKRSGEERVIVSDVPGTTRDSIDTRLEWGRSEIVLIDTAGIRRRGKVASGPAAERYSTMRALKAISRADVAVLVVDAEEGLTAQDAHVAGYVVDEGRGLVIALNKWDIVEEKTGRTFDEYVARIRRELPFLDFAPIVSISAKTGQRVERVLEAAVDVWGERRRRVGTGELNRLISAATERQTPPVVKGKRPKVFYGTQAAVAPPTFVFFANDAALIHFSYRRYLENRQIGRAHV